MITARMHIRLALALLLAPLTACAVSKHATGPADLGVAHPSGDMLAHLAESGPIELETVASCDWSVDRRGLINLKHPTARAAGLRKGPEPIQIYFHVLRHPTRGTFLVDTGVETALRDAPKQAALRGAVANYMKIAATMKFLAPLGEWLTQHPQPLAGVFLTHLHVDHISGMADVPAGTPIYTGPGENGARAFFHLFTRKSTGRALAGKPPLRELQFSPDPDRRFAGVLDLFGDGSVWALWVPGHTPGSLAFLVRSTRGPVLLTGDASHTRWGWEHDVEPGKFSADIPQSAASMQRLRALVREHPEISVRLGHQP